jgi:hypothetical protein
MRQGRLDIGLRLETTRLAWFLDCHGGFAASQ